MWYCNVTAVSSAALFLSHRELSTVIYTTGWWDPFSPVWVFVCINVSVGDSLHVSVHFTVTAFYFWLQLNTPWLVFNACCQSLPRFIILNIHFTSCLHHWASLLSFPLLVYFPFLLVSFSFIFSLLLLKLFSSTFPLLYPPCFPCTVPPLLSPTFVPFLLHSTLSFSLSSPLLYTI